MRADRVGGELGVEGTDGLAGNAHIGRDESFERPAVPVALEVVLRWRKDEPFRMHVGRRRVEPGIATAEVEMMGDGSGEADDLAGDKNR